MIDLGQIHALLELQKRAVANAFRERSQRRGFAASIVFGGLWYGFWIAAAAICTAAPHLIGTEDFEGALGGLLVLAMAYWQLSPLITLSLGASLEMRKLALYPASVPTLFFMECLLRIWTAFEVLVVIAGLFLGLATAGALSPVRLLIGFVLFVAFNIFLSAGIRNLVERIFQKRMLREAVLIGLVALTILPQALMFSAKMRGWMRAAAANRLGIPYWATPAGLSARVSLGDAGPGDFAILIGMVFAAGVFGFLMFRSSCRLTSASTAGEQAPRIRRGGRSRLRSLISRLIPDPLGTMVDKEIRYLWRSPRFRLPYFLGFTFGVIAWAPIVLRMEGRFGELLQTSAPSFIALYSLLLLGPVLFLNRFGFDRGAARFYFWMPVSFGRILAAKNITTVAYAAAEVGAILVMCAAVGLPVGWPQVMETLAVAAVALLYLMAVGNRMSVQFPIPSNPDRVSRGGAGHGLHAIVHFFLFPLSLTPVLLSFIARYLSNPAGFAISLSAAALGGFALYWLSFGRSVAYGSAEGEALTGILASGEGPVASH